MKSDLINVIARPMGRLARRILSPSQHLAVRGVADECVIAMRHRAGRRLLRKHALLRPQKLNLGSGEVKKPGFLNVDLYPGGDVTLDLRLGLPFESDCCDLIFSEHFFEHVDYPEPITQLLIECLRVLRPGGELRFSVPIRRGLWSTMPLVTGRLTSRLVLYTAGTLRAVKHGSSTSITTFARMGSTGLPTISRPLKSCCSAQDLSECRSEPLSHLWMRHIVRSAVSSLLHSSLRSDSLWLGGAVACS